MMLGAVRFGMDRFGASLGIEGAPPRAFGGAVFGSQFYGYSTGLAGEITGDAIGISGAAVASVGGYAIVSADVGVGGTAAGAIVLTGVTSGDIGLGADAYGVITHDGTASGDVGVSGTVSGYIIAVGEVTGNAIGIDGIAFGFSGNVAAYDRVSARLATSITRARLGNDPVRGRLSNIEVKGRNHGS